MKGSQVSLTRNINKGLGTVSTQLSAIGQNELCTAGRQRRWARGDELIREAESARTVLLIRQGRVKVSLTAACGRQVLLAIRGPGDLIGETAAIDDRDRSATVTALTDVDAVTLSQAAFLGLLDANPALKSEILITIAARLRESTQRRLEQGVYDVPGRTARWLLDAAYSEPIAGGPGYVVRLTQNELADAVGASRESVAKALKHFREENVIATKRGAFHVLQPGKLRELADRSRR